MVIWCPSWSKAGGRGALSGRTAESRANRSSLVGAARNWRIGGDMGLHQHGEDLSYVRWVMGAAWPKRPVIGHKLCSRTAK